MRVQIQQGVEMLEFDTDVENDVMAIGEMYVKPSVDRARGRNREAILVTLAYYSENDSPLCQLMFDRCQDLELAEPESWTKFFRVLGRAVFGGQFESLVDLSTVVEQPNEEEAWQIFC
jgi:hypothetical protein